MDNEHIIGQGGPQLNPFAYPSEKCENCGSEVFLPGVMFKRIPGLLIGAGTEEVDVPIKVAVCAKCGTLSPSDAKMLKEKTDAAKNTQNNETKSNLII